MNNNSFLRFICAACGAALLLIGCDKDFNEYGAGIVGEDHFELNDTIFSVVAFNQKTGTVQTNNLPVNQLGIYKDDRFGTTTANFVTQLSLYDKNVEINKELFVSLDSVVLTVPYTSTKSTAGGKNTYDIKGIRGTGSLDLKVYENGYFLTDLDPATGFTKPMKYYADQDPLFNSMKVGNPLNNAADPSENTAFKVNESEYIVFKRDKALEVTDKIESRQAPRMSLHLNKDVFLEKIINAPDDKLANNASFRNYFKGLYFQVQGDPGLMMQLDFSKGDVTLYYRKHAAKVKPGVAGDFVKFDHDNDPSTPEIYKDEIQTYRLNMAGNTVNLIQQSNAPAYADAISNPDMINGDERLHLKGGTDGSVAYIDLFQTPGELEHIRDAGWQVNEASLTFYVDRQNIGDAGQPERIYLYDARNERPIIDYTSDKTTASTSSKAKSIYDGIVKTETGTDGRTRYKVRITRHISNIIKSDSTNVRLGLSVTDVIENSVMAATRTAQPEIDAVPVGSVVSPLGTVLYGNTGNPATEVKLEIYYTKPKQ
jgi:hypothetical protein